MKKAIVLGSIAALSFAAHAEMKAPTVYGRLHKELRYTQQDDSYGARPNVGVREGHNSPSNLGVKGNLPINNWVNVDYKLEMGIYSEEKTGEGGVQVRQAAMTFNTDFGKFIFGETYTAGFAVAKFDPLWMTGNGHIGVSQNKQIENYGNALKTTNATRVTGEGIGMRERHRKNLVGYKSPKMMGLQLHVTHDNNDNFTDTANTNVDFTDAVLSYDNKFGMFGVKAHLGYLMGTGSLANKEAQMTGALMLSAHGFDLSGAYTATNWEVTSKDVDQTQILGAVAYTIGKCKLALSYAMSEIDDKASLEKREATQMTAGLIHNFSKNVMADITYANYVIEDTSTTASFVKNKVDRATAGITLKF